MVLDFEWVERSLRRGVVVAREPIVFSLDLEHGHRGVMTDLFGVDPVVQGVVRTESLSQNGI